MGKKGGHHAHSGGSRPSKGKGNYVKTNWPTAAAQTGDLARGVPREKEEKLQEKPERVRKKRPLRKKGTKGQCRNGQEGWRGGSEKSLPKGERRGKGRSTSRIEKREGGRTTGKLIILTGFTLHLSPGPIQEGHTWWCRFGRSRLFRGKGNKEMTKSESCEGSGGNDCRF